MDASARAACGRGSDGANSSKIGPMLRSAPLPGHLITAQDDYATQAAAVVWQMHSQPPNLPPGLAERHDDPNCAVTGRRLRSAGRDRSILRRTGRTKGVLKRSMVEVRCV